MCKNPGLLADGTQIACRQCSLCKARIRNDWIGRCIAESKTAKACHVINLTYGRNRHGDVLHERSVLLTYSDIQKFLKLLRRHGYPVRYFVTGEYGNEKGRAHWHIILFWQDKVPPFAGWSQSGEWLDKAEEEQRFNWVRLNDDGEVARDSEGEPHFFWPHGFAYFQPVTQKTIQYVCYYVLKELDHEGRQYHCAQSKKPPLGMAYFEQLAERMVEAGIAPQTPEYRFPGVTRRKRAGGREVIPFWLKDRPLEMFLDHYLATWAELKGDQPRPRSELVDLYEEFGRVVSEETATAKRIEHISTHKLLAPIRPPRREYDGSLWAPLARLSEWWQTDFEGYGDGQERQREVEDVEFHEQWIDAYEKCVANGAEPGHDLVQQYQDVCRALANYHRFESVGEWKRSRQGECVDPGVPVEHDYGPSRLDRLKAGYQAFHSQARAQSQPQAGSDACGTGPGQG